MDSSNKNKQLRIAELAGKIMFHKQIYYSGQTLISDPEYDALEDELRVLYPDHPALSFVGKALNSETLQSEHKTPMLSLGKTYSEDALQSWIADNIVVGMLKIDGNSLSLVYDDSGKLVTAKTRGDGKIGETATDKVQWVDDIVKNLHTSFALEIRGELYCNNTSFAKLCDAMSELNLERPTSPRNIVAGLLGRKGYAELARFFNFFAFDIIASPANLKFQTEQQKFKWLEEKGFTLPNPRLLTHRKDILIFLDEIKSIMNDDEIPVDGAVFSYNDLKLHDELGNTAHHPRYKMAFKWQGQTAISTITKISWATSRLGIVTPVAVIDPVFISNATITNITLHNFAHVKAYDIKIGDKIEIVRSGEVIPKFLRVVEPSQKEKCSWPLECPSCGSKLFLSDIRLLCKNSENCPAQITGNILNWITCVGIDDLSEKRLENLIAAKLVENIPSLYKITKEDLLTLPATKEKMAEKLFNNIQKTKHISLTKFLGGLGIEGIGESSWEKLIEFHPTIEEILSLSEEDIIAVDGFAQKSAAQIIKGLQNKLPLINKLLKIITIEQAAIISTSDKEKLPLYKKQFVITGSLSRPRSEIETLIKKAGGITSSSVSKNTFALITNETNSTSSKMKKAESLGIQIWNEDFLLTKIKQ